MSIDHNKINRFLSQSSLKSSIGELVRQNGFEITWIKEGKSDHTWGLYLKPNQPLRDALSITQEVLLWFVDFEEFQPRTISQAIEIINEERPRLSEQFSIIITPDPNTHDKVRSIGMQLSPICIGFSEKEIREFASNNIYGFLQALQYRLFAKDPYWKSTPIESPRNFYGRREQLSEVASSLVINHTHIGLFGLRKMGKTSFLYRLLELLQQSFSCHVCYLDIELIDAVDPSAEYFLFSLGNSILQSMGKIRVKGLQLFGKWPSFTAIENKNSIPELFIQDMKLILSQSKDTIVIALDEIELMAPPEIIKGSNWGRDGFVKIWRILRGLAQQNPGRISFFVTGTNPKFIEVNRLGEVDNPIYNFFRKDYLGPFRSLHSRQLLKEIGDLAGLIWEEDAIDVVYRRVGGHPLLLRAYGSAIHNAKLLRNSKVVVTVDDVVGEAQNFMRKVNPHLSQMLDVISDYYKDEYTLLELLATGRIGEFKEFALAFPDETSHLIGYGLIEFTRSKCEFIVEPLQTWIQRKNNLSPLLLGDISQGNDPLIGREIDGYKIEASIGHIGGFARVYRAKSDETGQYGAVKVLRNGVLTILQREVDMLSDVNHPNIVKLISSGKTPDGIVYLIMEYLEGNTLKSYCDRTSRLAPEQVVDLAKGLLSALESIHPNNDLANRVLC